VQGAHKRLGVVIAALCAVLLILAIASPPASARACRSTLLYPPANGGHALIIEKLRVRRVSCRAATRIAGRYVVGERLPRGWRCRVRGQRPTVCRRGKRSLTYFFGGDAG